LRKRFLKIAKNATAGEEQPNMAAQAVPAKRGRGRGQRGSRSGRGVVSDGKIKKHALDGAS